jgi:hypothetical protein
MKPMAKYNFPNKIPANAGWQVWVIYENGKIIAAAVLQSAVNGFRNVHGFASAERGAGSRLLDCLKQRVSEKLKVAPSPDSVNWWKGRPGAREVKPGDGSGNFITFD